MVVQARRDEAVRAQLARKTANKMARAELIEAQRQAVLLEMQHIRKDILQQEAWLRVRHPLPPLSSLSENLTAGSSARVAWAAAGLAAADVAYPVTWLKGP